MRQSYLIAGMERSGKTFFAEQIANAYIRTGRPAVLYNAGMDKDFSDALICAPITPDELMRMTPKKMRYKIDTFTDIEFFRDETTGAIVPFKFFRKYYAGKKVKIYRVDDEHALFRSIFKYVYDTLIIFDDIRATTRGGMYSSFVQLVSRKNHSGMRNTHDGAEPGIDTIFIYHALDTAPKEIFDYCTRIILFRLMRIPDAHIANAELWSIVSDSVETLKGLPKFSNIEILLRESENIETIINKK